jgi:hypothetical protein
MVVDRRLPGISVAGSLPIAGEDQHGVVRLEKRHDPIDCHGAAARARSPAGAVPGAPNELRRRPWHLSRRSCPSIRQRPDPSRAAGQRRRRVDAGRLAEQADLRPHPARTLRRFDRQQPGREASRRRNGRGLSVRAATMPVAPMPTRAVRAGACRTFSGAAVRQRLMHTALAVNVSTSAVRPPRQLHGDPPAPRATSSARFRPGATATMRTERAVPAR